MEWISLPIAIYLTFADPQRVTNEYPFHGAREASTGATSARGGKRANNGGAARRRKRDSLNSCTRPLAGQRRNNVDTKRPVDRGISSYGGAANLTLRGVQGRAFSPCCRQMPAQFSTLIQKAKEEAIENEGWMMDQKGRQRRKGEKGGGIRGEGGRKEGTHAANCYDLHRFERISICRRCTKSLNYT